MHGWMRRLPSWHLRFGAASAGLALLALVAMVPGAPSAQQTEVLPPSQLLAPPSTVHVGALPAAEHGERAGPAPQSIRRRVRDPAGLRQWKELLESAPATVPPAPGYVGDLPLRRTLEPGPGGR